MILFSYVTSVFGLRLFSLNIILFIYLRSMIIYLFVCLSRLRVHYP